MPLPIIVAGVASVVVSAATTKKPMMPTNTAKNLEILQEWHRQNMKRPS